MTKVIAIIPAYNEELTIGPVIKGIKGFVDNVVVVDDHSSDNTAANAQKAGAVVVGHKKNGGYDKAINSGFRKAHSLGADIFVTFDADGQHRAEDLKKLLEYMKKNKADVATGIRKRKARLAEYFFAVYSKKKLSIKDPLCGMKAYTKKTYEDLGQFDTIGSIGTELMFSANKNNAKIVTMPIKLSKRDDKSRFYHNNIKGNLKIFRAMFRVMSKYGV